MKEIRFTIETEGNPMPKIKLTKRQQWMPRAQKYAIYKARVRNAFFDALDKAMKKQAELNTARCGKPLITEKAKCRMDLQIHFASHASPDPESVFGAIADALFFNDKYLAGSFDFDHPRSKQAKGKVDVLLTISE